MSDHRFFVSSHSAGLLPCSAENALPGSATDRNNIAAGQGGCRTPKMGNAELRCPGHSADPGNASARCPLGYLFSQVSGLSAIRDVGNALPTEQGSSPAGTEETKTPPATDGDGLPDDLDALLDEIARDRVTRIRRRRESISGFRAERQAARDAGKARLAAIKLARLTAGTNTAAPEAATTKDDR